MQTYQSLCMYRQHHKSQIHIKTTHSHQRGVSTLQERCGPEPRERSSCGSCETCTDTQGSVCPTAASLSWSLGWARQQQGRDRGRGKGRGEQWLRGWGEGRAWAATAERGRQWRRLDWAPGERGGFSAFSCETRLQQPGRQSDRR